MAGGVPQHELFHRYSKYSFDAFRVADRDLDMCFFAEAGAGVDGWAFGEDGFYCVKGGEMAFLKNCVKTLRHRAIKISPQLIATVDWDL